MARSFLAVEEQDNYIYEDDPNLFTVDKILKCRTKKSKNEYLVQWEGYSKYYNSWVPEVDITPDLKKLFHQNGALTKKERKRKGVTSKRNSSKKTGEALYTNSIEKSHMAVLEQVPMSLTNEIPVKNLMENPPVVALERLPLPIMPFYPEKQ